MNSCKMNEINLKHGTMELSEETEKNQGIGLSKDFSGLNSQNIGGKKQRQ